MKKMFKKLCSVALGVALTATSVISTSISSYAESSLSLNFDYTDFPYVSSLTALDKDFSDFLIGTDYDKYYNNFSFNVDTDYDVKDYYSMYYCSESDKLYYTHPAYNYLSFVVNKDIEYNDAVDEKITEICNEYFIETLKSTLPTYSYYGPDICHYTSDDGSIFYSIYLYSTNDLVVETAKEHSPELMEKLNEENLISEFYDLGEVFAITEYNSYYMTYSESEKEIINQYIAENNLNCEFNHAWLVFNDDLTMLEKYEIGYDIYKATSIELAYNDTEIETPMWWNIFGTNSLDESSGNNFTQITEPIKILGDANGDSELNVRDCSYISRMLANGKVSELPESADYNKDGKINVRDVSTLARDLANK